MKKQWFTTLATVLISVATLLAGLWPVRAAKAVDAAPAASKITPVLAQPLSPTDFPRDPLDGNVYAHINCCESTNDNLKFGYTDTVAPVKIGTLLPFSGALSAFGEPCHRSALLAVKHLEEAGYEVETVVADTKTSATAAIEAAGRLVQVEGVHVLIGAAASGVTIPVAESVSIPSQVLQISHASTSPFITMLPADEGKDFLFRTCSSDALQGKVLGKMIIEDGLTKVSALYVNNYYGEGLNDTLSVTFESLGGTVVASVPHDEAPAATYVAELQQATEGEPEVLVAISYPGHAKVYLKEAIEGGFIDNFRFVDGTKSQEIIDAVGAETLEGMCGTAPGTAETESLEIFEAEYEAEYGGPPSLPFMANTYDAVIVAALAAYEAQMAGEELTSISIRDHLRSVAGPPGKEIVPGVDGLERALELLQGDKDINYVGASGDVDFDENGDVVTAIETWCYEGGDIVTERLETPSFTVTTVEADTDSTIIYTSTSGLTTTLEVPAGAVTKTTVIAYTPDIPVSDRPGGLWFAGQSFALEAYQGGKCVPGLTFSGTVSITTSYEEGLDEESLVLYTRDGSTWVDAAYGPYQRDTVNNILRVPICHLSDFALFGEPNRVYLPLVLRSFP